VQDIKEKGRENRSNENTGICFEIRATALCPRLHTKGFSLYPHRIFHKRTSTEELQLQNWSTQLHSLSPLHKSKAQSLAQSKEELKFSDLMITNSLLVISEDHKQFFSKKQDLVDRYRIK